MRADIHRAKRWYSDKLGLEPVSIDGESLAPGSNTSLQYAQFSIYSTSHAGKNKATAIRLLVDGETVGVAFKLMRDMLVFTDRRLISIDKQGVTGKKVEYRSIPYSSITVFSKESAGMLDLEAEFKVWIYGMADPLQFTFTKDAPINDVYRLLSEKLVGT